MQFFPFEVTAPHIIYACLGGFIVLFGMFSLVLRSRLYIGEACWAFLFGVIIGPYCAGIFDPRSWGDGDEGTTDTVTLEFTRVVLAIGVFAIGVELPKAYMARHWKSLLFLLVPVMTWGWFVSAGLIYAFIPGLNFLSSLAVAACLTPTDPILAAAVVGGKWADKHVPAHIRHLLAAESGCNDGAAFPFLFIALYLLLGHGNTGHAIRDWFLLLWLYQVIVGIVIGGLLGFAFRHLMKFCERHDLIDRHSYVAQYVSLAIFTIGVCTLLGSDDLLAAFACGTAFAWDGFFNRQTEESVFSSVIDLLFNIAAFVFVGAWMPFSSFHDQELTLTVWRLLVIAILILILRRLPVMIVLYRWIPDVKTFRESLFVGHFGPIGIGAVFISTLATQVVHHRHIEGELDHELEMLTRTIQPIVAFMVLCSITIHGLSIPSFSLGRRVHSVSRTWSRRETIDEANPDWTNQITRITKPDDVVINRDHADLEMARKESARKNSDHLDQMEKGENQLSPERIKQRRDTDEGSAETKVALGNSSARASSFTEVDAIDRGEGEHLDTRRRLAGDYREESPPDGGEDYMEWVEGDATVIERRSLGHGDDVEVAVERDSPSSSVERGFSLQSMKRSARNAEEKIKAKWPPRLSSPETPSLTSPIPPALERAVSSPPVVITHDEDEEWASENDNNEPVAGSSSTSQIPPKSDKKRSRVFGRKRHKISLRRADPRVHDENDERRGRTGHGTAFPITSTSISSPAIVSSGHSQGHKRADSVPTPQVTITTPGGVGASRSGYARHGHGTRPRTADSGARPRTADSVRNIRLENIRAQASRPPTREASPSRSVRFVDEPLSPASLDFPGGISLSPRPSRIWGSSGTGDVTPGGTRTPEGSGSGSGTLTPKDGLEIPGGPVGSK